MLPRQLGDVNQAVDPTEVNEGTKVNDGGHDTAANLTLLEGVQEVGANLRLGLLKPCAAGQNNVVTVLIQLDDLGFNLTTDVRSEIANATHFNEGCGEEATQADVQDQAALDDLDDGTGNNAVFFLDLLDLSPCALVLCTLLGQEQAAFLVLLLENQGLDLITNGNHIIRVDIVLDGKLAREDDTLGLVANVKKDLIVVNLDDSALDDVAIVEVLDGLVNSGEQVLAGPNVVHCNLGCRNCRLRVGAGHVVVFSETDVLLDMDNCGCTMQMAIARSSTLSILTE